MSWPKDKVFKTGDELVAWLKENYNDYIKNHISSFDVHHTYRPDHSNYPENTTLELHQAMRRYHMNVRGWSDIGQHVSNGKDGLVVTGLPITSMPASAYGHNGSPSWHPFMIENIGNFDVGHDEMEGVQLATLCALGHYLHCELGKPVRFHNEMSGKTCPGSGLDKSWLVDQFAKYKTGKVNYEPHTSPQLPTEQKGSYVGKRVESIYKGSEGLVFRNKPSWSDSDVVGVLKYGWGFPEIVAKVNVQGSAQYKVKNSKGAIYYVTAAPEFVKVEGETVTEQPTHSAPRVPTHGGAIVPYPGHYIKEGSNDVKNVKRVQRAVNVTVDGDFGPKTKRAVAAYQDRHGLQVDGIVGPETWNMMF